MNFRVGDLVVPSQKFIDYYTAFDFRRNRAGRMQEWALSRIPLKIAAVWPHRILVYGTDGVRWNLGNIDVELATAYLLEKV